MGGRFRKGHEVHSPAGRTSKEGAAKAEKEKSKGQERTAEVMPEKRYYIMVSGT